MGSAGHTCPGADVRRQLPLRVGAVHVVHQFQFRFPRAVARLRFGLLDPGLSPRRGGATLGEQRPLKQAHARQSGLVAHRTGRVTIEQHRRRLGIEFIRIPPAPPTNPFNGLFPRLWSTPRGWLSAVTPA